MTDTTTVDFEVLGIDRVTGADRLVALAVVEIVLDGVALVIQGIKVTRDGNTVGCELPCYRHDGAWLPAVVLPPELGKAIAREIYRQLGYLR